MARRRFSRPLGDRRYKKMYVIAVEGRITEQQYFSRFHEDSVLRIKCLTSNTGSAPLHVLRRLKRCLKEDELLKTDEAWVVVDRDQWSEEDLERLLAWSGESEQFGFALSNPKFEFWLLLHFEDGTTVSSPQQCDAKLRRYIPDYHKHLPTQFFTDQQVRDAVGRAQRRDVPPTQKWPVKYGSTVYRLVERILRGNSNE